MTTDKKDTWISDVIIAICSWLDETNQMKSVSSTDYISSIFKDAEQKEKIVKRIFEVCPSDAEKFFQCIYDEKNKCIDIENGKLDNVISSNIFENFITTVDPSLQHEQTLENYISNYFTKAGKDNDPDINSIFNIVNNGRMFRNKIPHALKENKQGKKKELSKKEWIEIWESQLRSLILISATEGLKPQKPQKQSTGNEGLKRWLAENKSLFANINVNFYNNYISDTEQIAKKVEKIVSSEKALRETWEVLLKLIDGNGNTCQTSNIGLEIDPSAFLETFLHCTNTLLYSNTNKSIESPNWDQDLDMIQKLSQHIKYSDQEVFNDIMHDHTKLQPIGKCDSLSSDEAWNIDNFFFKAICLIGAVSIAIKKCTSGIVFYANNNISIMPFAKAKHPVPVTKYNPYFYQLKDEPTVPKISKVTGSIGDFSIEKTIKNTKGKWTVIIFDFPPKQEGSIKKIIEKVSFPGLLDLESYYNEQDRIDDDAQMPPMDTTVVEPIVDIPKAEGVVFKKKGGKVSMASATQYVDIYYTLDGTEPSRKSLLYKLPIRIKQGTLVKAVAIRKNYSNSQVTTYIVPPSGSSTDTIREFLGRYWLGLVGLVFLALVIASAVYIGKSLDFTTREDEPVEQIVSMPKEQFPILDGRAWQVKEMEDIKIPDGQGNAKIVSMNDEGTDCKMIITTNLRSQYREINFHYNRLTGSLHSPELGEGKVEILTGFVTLKITFKGWIIEK